MRTLRRSSRQLLRERSSRGNAVWLTVEQIFQLPLSFVVSVFVARHLGVANFGILSAAIALSVLISPFWSASQALIVRDITSRAAPETVVLGSATFVHFLATLIATGVAVIALIAFPNVVPVGGTFPALIVLSTVPLRTLLLIDYSFQAHLRARDAVLARGSAMVLVSTLRLLAVVDDAPVLVFALLSGVEAVLMAAVMLIAYRKGGGRISTFRIERNYAVGLAKECLPLLGSGLGVVLYMRIDQTMLGTLSGARETGLYSIAVTLSEVIFFLPVILFKVFMPGMTRLYDQNRASYENRLQGIFSAAMAIVYLTTTTAALIGPIVIPLVYGAQYVHAIPVFLILLLATPFVSLGVVQSIWTAHTGRQGLALFRIGVAAALNVALNLILLPTYGALGAAITTVTAYAFAGVLMNAVMPPCWPVLRLQLSSLRLHGIRSLMTELTADLSWAKT